MEIFGKTVQKKRQILPPINIKLYKLAKKHTPTYAPNLNEEILIEDKFLRPE
jgi:hypothetical protein